MRRRSSVGERFREGIESFSSDPLERGGHGNPLCSKSLDLRRAEGGCSESGMFSTDGWGAWPKNPGNGPHMVRSRRSRVVMGARSVGRERRSPFVPLEKGRPAQGQEPFICSETAPQKEPSNRKRFFNWVRRLSGKKDKKVDKDVEAGASPDKGNVVAKGCESCAEVSGEQRRSFRVSGSYYETEVLYLQYWILKNQKIFIAVTPGWLGRGDARR